MLAMDYRGVRVDNKPTEILHSQGRASLRDAFVHLRLGPAPLQRRGPDTRIGTTFGHEFTGIVEELGEDVQNLKPGDPVLVPFKIASGKCVFCSRRP